MRPDVVHFHHFFTFGVDLLTLTRRELPDARIVFTFHEFMSICAADGQMVRKTDRSLCTRASGVRCHQCFPDRSPEQFLMRRLWMQRHLSVVDAFTCPSHFMLDIYETLGTAGASGCTTSPTASAAMASQAAAVAGPKEPVRLLRPVGRQQGRADPAARRAPAARAGIHRFRRRDQRRNIHLASRAGARGDRGFPGGGAGIAAGGADRAATTVATTSTTWPAGWRGWTGASCRPPGGRFSAW